jgi:O-antigen/teichoic acid export membrane protein
MSLKHNILAGYASQIYVTVIGIIMVPLYIRYMGAETYGLVGFFATLQAVFVLLDLGLTPTMARETARFWGGATDAHNYQRFVRALQGLFFSIAVIGGLAMYAASGYLSSDWLHAKKLSTSEIKTAIEIMAAIVALRWTSGLYRGVISGSERLVWLGGYNMVLATLRFVGVLPVLQFVGATPTLFFSYQLGVAILEFAGLLIYAYRLLRRLPKANHLSWSLSPLRPVLKFSLAIAFTSSTWILVTQVDKLVLSKLLPLASYGYFTLAVLVAGGVTMISGPITNALMPRLAKLEAENNHDGMVKVYRRATQLVAVIAGASSATLAFFSEPLLWAWTGNKLIAHQAAPILTLYSLGNGFLAVSSFPYFLQYAKGNLRLQLIANMAFIFLLVPAVILAARQYGAVGAGYVWLAMNIIYLISWVPFVHRHFVPGLNLPWFGRDVMMIYAAANIAAYTLYAIMPLATSRLQQGGEIVLVSSVVLFSAALASSFVFKTVKIWFLQKIIRNESFI